VPVIYFKNAMQPNLLPSAIALGIVNCHQFLAIGDCNEAKDYYWRVGISEHHMPEYEEDPHILIGNARSRSTLMAAGIKEAQSLVLAGSV